MAKRAGRFIKWFSVLFTAASFLVMFTPVSNFMASRLVVPAELERSDLIVVLGGGAFGNGVLGRSTVERLVRGLELYRAGYAPKVLFSGGAPLGSTDKMFHTLLGRAVSGNSNATEAALMEDTAVRLGIPKVAVATDTVSENTYENLVETKKYMESNGLKSCIIVTSATHMKRAALVARKLGLHFHPAPVKDSSGYRTGSFERVLLFREAAWEYLGLLLYRVYGYV